MKQSSANLDYDRAEILGGGKDSLKSKSLKIEFTGKARTVASFIEVIKRDIAKANYALGQVNQKNPQDSTTKRIYGFPSNLRKGEMRKDVMMKFKVRLFKVEWV